MKEYFELGGCGGLLFLCCCYHSFSVQQSLASHVLSTKILVQFKLVGKRVANIEGIKWIGFKNSLEKSLTYTHINKLTLGAFNMPMIYSVRKVKF